MSSLRPLYTPPSPVYSSLPQFFAKFDYVHTNLGILYCKDKLQINAHAHIQKLYSNVKLKLKPNPQLSNRSTTSLEKK